MYIYLQTRRFFSSDGGVGVVFGVLVLAFNLFTVVGRRRSQKIKVDETEFPLG